MGLSLEPDDFVCESEPIRFILLFNLAHFGSIQNRTAVDHSVVLETSFRDDRHLVTAGGLQLWRSRFLCRLNQAVSGTSGKTPVNGSNVNLNHTFFP